MGQATPFPCGIKSIEFSLEEAINVDKSRPDPSKGALALWAVMACRLRLSYSGMCRCATLRLVSEGDCHATFDKGPVGFGVDFEFRRCCSRTGCRRWWCWYWRRRWDGGRQRRRTGWNRDGAVKWKRHYRFNARGVGFEHNWNVVRQFAGKNEKGDDGRAGLRQRYEEALLTGRCRIKKHLSKAPRSSLLSRKLAKQRHAQPERWGPG